MARSTVQELQRRLAALEAENSALRGDTAAMAPAATPDPTVSHRRSRGWGRALAATVLVLLGTLIAPVALIAAWGNVQLTDTDRFVARYSVLASDPAVQSAVTDQVVEAIEGQVDIPALTTDVIDGVIELGTGPAATRALELLKGPAAQGLQSLVGTVVERFVESEAFANVWASALRISHSQVVSALQNDPDAAIALGPDGTIGIQLAPIIDAAKDVLVDQGVGFAASIPTVDRTITVAQVDSLASVQLAYELVVAAGLWLPWVAILFLAAGVVAARRRSVALITAALSLGLVMLIVLAGLAIGRVFFDAALRSNGIPAEAGGAIYELVGGAMRDTAVAVLVLALVTAVVGWFAGPFDVPRRLRAVVHGGASSVRGALERRGLSSGRVGTWLHSRRSLLRGMVIVAAAAVVLLIRPLSPALVLWTLVLSLLVVLVLEVVERPPSADADGDAIDGVASEGEVREGVARDEADVASADPLGRASS
ncbi:hypothetical protein [Microbacterium sp. APC 3901]|uniref:hypothetical protein n=1 Tax=Microbacterium sp. APC 3901 TaxID=3035192 RepID=UPI0025B2CEFB|nr:hypothetical protein [Microbacterium sp. APC 3901]MDN3444600.1 hypothetical protein [Microbacterium sp. APC 3901]